MSTDTIIKDTSAAMDKAIEHMSQEFASVRTGKASPSLVENVDIPVESYGSSMKLKDLAMITTPEPRLIQVNPFDPAVVPDIEKGIRESKVGINPNVDGKIIRLPIPELSEERRKDLVKIVKQMAEDTRVRIRGSRKDGMDAIKNAQKEGELTEDDVHIMEKEVQELTDSSGKKVDEQVAKKEAEVMTV